MQSFNKKIIKMVRILFIAYYLLFISTNQLGLSLMLFVVRVFTFSDQPFL
jgi:hypothetical protein